MENDLPQQQAPESGPGIASRTAEQNERQVAARKLNDSAERITPQAFVNRFFSGMPEPDGIPAFEMERPLRIDDSRANTATDSGSIPLADALCDPDWRDKNRSKFHPGRHRLLDSGQPELTEGGLYKMLRKKERAGVASGQLGPGGLPLEVARKLAAEKQPATESGSGQPAKQPEQRGDPKRESASWIAWLQDLLSIFWGDEAAFSEKERRLFEVATERGFEKWGVVQFSVTLAASTAATAYLMRRFKGKFKRQPKAEQTPNVPKPEQVQPSPSQPVSGLKGLAG